MITKEHTYVFILIFNLEKKYYIIQFLNLKIQKKLILKYLYMLTNKNIF